MPNARHPAFLLGLLGAASLLNGFIVIGLHLSQISPLLERALILLEAAFLPALVLLAYKATRERCECERSAVEFEGGGLKRREFLSMGFKLLIVATLAQLGLGRVAKAMAAPQVAKVKRLEVLDSRRLDEDLARDFAEKIVKREFVRSLLGKTGLGVKVPAEGVSAGEHIVMVDGEPAKLTAVGIPVDERHVVLARRFEFDDGDVKEDAFLWEIRGDKLILKAVSSEDGGVSILGGCGIYCRYDSECPLNYYCSWYCCDISWTCVLRECAQAAYCAIPCAISTSACIACILVWCAYSTIGRCCERWGKKCFKEPPYG